MGRFDEFVYTIPKRYTQWGDMYANPRAFFRGNDSLWNSKLNMGFSVVKKPGLAEFPHFHHSVEEYYMFSGSDLTKFFDFDAEIELWIGEDPDRMECYTITKPTLVRIPANMWHGPINYKRVDKPVAFSSIYFDGELAKITRRINSDDSVSYPYIGSSLQRCIFDRTSGCIHCGKCVAEQKEQQGIEYAFNWAAQIANSTPPEKSGKYDKLFYTYPQEYHNYGDTYANPRGKFRGKTQMPEANFYGGFTVAMKPVDMEVPHIHHANDEYLWFIGADLENVFDFDAEVEIWLGETPEHMEKITITEPTIIRVPPGMWHCPINFKRIDKPVAFLPIYPDGDWSKVVVSKTEDGKDEYLFEAASLRKCSYNHDKLCNYCGKCEKDDSVPSFGVFTYRK